MDYYTLKGDLSNSLTKAIIKKKDLEYIYYDICKHPVVMAKIKGLEVMISYLTGALKDIIKTGGDIFDRY